MNKNNGTSKTEFNKCVQFIQKNTGMRILIDFDEFRGTEKAYLFYDSSTQEVKLVQWQTAKTKAKRHAFRKENPVLRQCTSNSKAYVSKLAKHGLKPLSDRFFVSDDIVKFECVACGDVFESTPHDIIRWGKKCRCQVKRHCPEYNTNKKLYSRYKQTVTRSNKKGFRDVFSFEEFLEIFNAQTCYYCGISLDVMRKSIDFCNRCSHRNQLVNFYFFKQKYINWTMDRKNNLLGYTKENTVACCNFCNSKKGHDISEEEMLYIAPKVMGRYLDALRAEGFMCEN